MRYWVATKTWTVERSRKYEGYMKATALSIPFHCDRPGALMGIRVRDKFWSSGLVIGDVTYGGRTTALCPH